MDYFCVIYAAISGGGLFYLGLRILQGTALLLTEVTQYPENVFPRP